MSTSHHSEDAGTAAVIAELSLPHSKFPFWTKEQVFNVVTGMYLDCWDDREIARTLSTELEKNIDVVTITDIRSEAAAMAERLPAEYRRKWIYRYKSLSVNNLVKEYMFMEGKTDFIQAKQELAEEIEYLVKNTSPDRLCIAVNDALGRNNIGPALIEKLRAYVQTVRRAETLSQWYAEKKGMLRQQAMAEISRKIFLAFNTDGRRNLRRTLSMMAEVLGQPQDQLEESDVEFFVGFGGAQAQETSPDDSVISRIAQNSDVMLKHRSILDQVLEDAAHHFSRSDLMQLLQYIRAEPVLSKQDLSKVRKYVVRHQKDVETIQLLGREPQMPEMLRKLEQQTLESLLILIERHEVLTDHQKFFSGREISRAKRCGITEPKLKAMLNTMNQLVDERQILAYAQDVQAQTKFEFPVNRYVEKRFRLPS